MSKKMLKTALTATLTVSIFLFVGCGSEETQQTESMFTDRDMEIGYDEETAVTIELTGDSATANSDGVQISGSTVTIEDEGTYIVTGTLDNGMIIVDADDSDMLQIVLSGADVTNQSSAALYIKNADKVFVTTAKDTQNSLTVTGNFQSIDENNIDGAIFSKADLTMNGAGTLTVTSAEGHGVVSKDDLVLTSGTYEITAEKQGLSGKDSVRIADGVYTITAGKDCIHSENEDEQTLGFVYIAGGTININAAGDGISAYSYLEICDGTFEINTGSEAVISTSETNDSFKGLKAGESLVISGGEFVIRAEDDAVHSNGDIYVDEASLEITSGDDGVHADNAVTIKGGSINITESYEGIEGLSVDISGGYIDITASDDGINAAGGSDGSGMMQRGGMMTDQFTSEEGAYINISGGTMYVDASGDGIDSNGDISVSGGETYVSGPTDSGNGALDYQGNATISGGIFVAAGPRAMAQNFGDSSTQGTMLVALSGSAGSQITLSDSDGTELLSWLPDKEYSSVVISCPEITEGNSYTVTGGSSSAEVTMNSTVYTASENMGMDSMGGIGGMDGMREPSGSMGGSPGVKDGLPANQADPGGKQ